MDDVPEITEELRKKLFAKEVWRIKDVMILCGLNYNTASAFIRQIKFNLIHNKNQVLRIEMEGRLHVQDYLDYIGKNDPNRYKMYSSDII